MAITEVGSGSQRATAAATSAVSSLNLAFPGSVTSGNLLVVAGRNWRSSGATVTVTDSLSTSYTVIQFAQATAFQSYIAYGIASSSGANTVTVTLSGSGSYPSFAIDEFAGVNTSTPLDVDGGNSTGTSTTASDSLTTTTSGALVVGVMGFTDFNTISLTVGSGYTQMGEYENQTNYTAFNAEFQIVSSATTYTPDWSLGDSVTWMAQTVAFQADSVGTANSYYYMANQ